jgi:amidohydrolase
MGLQKLASRILFCLENFRKNMKIKQITGLVFLVLQLFIFAGASAVKADTQQNLEKVIEAQIPLVQEAYQRIHSNPELGKKEFKTQAYLKEKLQALGYSEFVESTTAPTAVIAILDTGRPGKTIALRADMDARPLSGGKDEPADHNPRSQIAGVMHNCGHDVHASILLSAAGALQSNRDQLSGKIVFIFQPAEEVKGGADDIVNEGILTKLKVESIFAMHVAPRMPVGTVGISPGPFLAGSNYFTLDIKGDSSHAAVPFEGADVPLAAAEIVTGLSKLPSRKLNVVSRPAIISVTKIETNGKALNVLPSGATIKGTIRAFEDLTTSQAGQPSIDEIIVRYLKGTAAAYDVEYSWDLRKGSPPTVNDPELFKTLIPELTKVWPGQVDTTPSKGMFSEDFSYYTAATPALYFSLGVAKDGLGGVGVHQRDFTIHPDALREGVRLFVNIAQLTNGK